MKLIKKFFGMAALVALTSGSAFADYYACGWFQGWQIMETQAFVQGEDGLYRLEMDFGAGKEYKISTVLPTSASTGWSEFDTGAIRADITELYRGAILSPGIDNMAAPESRVLTVVINPELNQLAYTDGNQEIEWETPPAPWSGTLPVIFIDTENGDPVVSKEEYLVGTYYLDPMGIEGVEAFGSKEEPLTLKIKGRGNYTWTGFSKKPYRLKLDAKAGLLGMKKNKNFALLAHADDNHGFMRNTVGFEVSRRMGLEWTSSDKPVEVVLNGEYLGLYFLTETIKVDKDRVAVYEQPDGDASTDVTGGWLVELDNYDNDPHIEFYSVGDWERLIFTYKTPELLNEAQENWLYDQMKSIDRLVFDSNKSKAQWLDYVDLGELVNFYLVQEIMDNYESFHGSCYMHRDVDNVELALDGQATHKWKFGPVWDFGSVFFDEKTQFCYEGRPHHMTWIGEMCKFPEFMDAVKARWNEFYPSQYGDMAAYIDNFADNIGEAAKADFARWPEYGNEDVAWHAEDVKRRMENSVKWIDNLWGNRSDVQSLSEREALDLFVSNGTLVVKSPDARTLAVTNIDGTVQTLRLEPGRNYFRLPAGLYIAAGRKIKL